MAQIWLTYDELAMLMGLRVEAARAVAEAMPLARRKCGDGHTRAKLTPALMTAFLDRLLTQRIEDELRLCAGDLRAVHRRMMNRMAGRATPHSAVSSPPPAALSLSRP